MPIPKKDQTKQEFLKEYMSSEQAIKDFPDASQRYAIAESEWANRKKKHELGGIGEFPSGSSAYVPELIKKKDAERKYKR